MRNGQQKRMRGRNNNRRGSNPMTRVYESNGPDVKVRGTAHHIAEKYQQLARDAHSSGDYVAAENYYQHAEHYQRLIAALQGQMATQPGFGREDEMEDDEMDDVGGYDAPQPNYQPREQNYQQRDGQGGRDNQQRQPRDNRQNNNQQRRPRDDEGGEGNYQPREYRGQRNRDDDQQGNYQPRQPREQRAPREEGAEGNYAARPPRQPREDGEGYVPRAQRQPREDGEGYVARAPRPQRDEAEGGGYTQRPPRAPRGEGEGGYAARAPRAPREEGEAYTPRPPREPRAPRVVETEAPYSAPAEAAPAPVAAAPAPAPRASRARKEREEVQPQLGLPSFITGPVATPAVKERAAPATVEESEAADSDNPRFGRRRRRFRNQDEGGEDAAPATGTTTEPQFDN